MDGSYDSVFHQSGPSTPMSPNAPTGTPTQYKANVNRQKTRKWVEAKTIDYGGDDWGADYNEEPDEPEPQPEPRSHPRPFGPRSPATLSNNQQPPSPAGPRPLQTTGIAAQSASPALSPRSGARTSSGAPALHIQTQQHPDPRPLSFEGPPSQGSTPGVEPSRATSPPQSASVPQSAAASSAYSAGPGFGQGYGDSGASPTIATQGSFPAQRPRHMSPGPPGVGQVPTRFPRRKSSLSQQDAPADKIYSPVHGESGRPSIGSRPGSSHTNASSIMSPSKPPWLEGAVGGPRSASPSGSVRSPNTPGKQLPFVRPADIYKRLGEEREKGRRSMDSGRPSMDSIGPGQGSDTTGSLRTQSPPRTSQNVARQVQEQGQVRPDSEVMSPALTRATEVPLTEEVQVEASRRKRSSLGREDDENSTARSSRPSLATVAERRSEYNIEGLIASYEGREGTSRDTSQAGASLLATTAEPVPIPISLEDVPATTTASTSRTRPRAGPEPVEDQGLDSVKKTDFELTEGVRMNEATRSDHSNAKHGREDPEVEQLELEGEHPKQVQSGEGLRRLSTSPKLPELGRLSAFGLDLFSSSASTHPAYSSQSSKLPPSSPTPPVPEIPSSNTVLPTSPLSTGLELPPSESSVAQDASLVETYQKQYEPATGYSAGSSVQHCSTSAKTMDTVASVEAGDAGTEGARRVSRADFEPEEQTPKAGPMPPMPDRTASQGDNTTTDTPKGPLPNPEDVAVLQSGSGLESKSASEHLPSVVDKDLPAVPPSEASLVTQDAQASQLAISAPSPIVGSAAPEAVTSSSSSTTDPKLVLDPLLVEHSYSAKPIPAQVSTSDSNRSDDNMSQQPRATSDSAQSPASASKLTPVDNQVIPPQNLSGPSLSDEYRNYLSTVAESSTKQPSSTQDGSADGDIDPTMPKEQLVEGEFIGDISEDTIVVPPQPSTAPPPRPDEMSRQETFMTARESPSLLSDNDATPAAKDSDKLSAEILRSLSPATPSASAASDTIDAAQQSSVVPSGANRESSFLPDLYDDYWNFAGSGNSNDANATPSVPGNSPPDAMPAALKVPSEELRPRSLVVINDDNTHSGSILSSAPSADESAVDVFKTDVQATTVELHRPILPNRFSWERDGIEAAKVDIQVEPKSLRQASMATAPSSTDKHTTPAVDKSDRPSADIAVESLADNTATTWTEKPVASLADHPGTSSEQASSVPRPDDTGAISQGSAAALPELDAENAAVVDRVPTPVSPTVLGPSPSTSEYPAHTHPGPLTSNPVMTFREILDSVQSSWERTQEFNKARQHYAHTNTGLSTILEHLAPDHPDIVAASGKAGQPSQMYTYNCPSIRDVGGLLSPPPTGTTPGTHRSNPTAHLGPKTKVFFATAGKASKGFLSTLKAKGKKDVLVHISASPIHKLPAGATSSIPEVFRPVSKHRRWTATSSSIHDSFASFSNSVRNELKQRHASFQVPAGRPALGSNNRLLATVKNDSDTNQSWVSQHESGTTTDITPGSARRGRLSLSGLITWAPGPQSNLRTPRPLLGGANRDGQQQQEKHQQSRNPSQLNVAGLPGLPVSSSPPASSLDITSPLPPLPKNLQLIGNVCNNPGDSSQLVSPLSETFSTSARPTPTPKDQDDNRAVSLVSLDSVDRLHVPAPISKYQPTWDPYTGTPLFEEEGFELYEEGHRPDEPTDSHCQAAGHPSYNTDDNWGGQSTDRHGINLRTSIHQGLDDTDGGRVVLVPGTTKTSERTELQIQLRRTQIQVREREKDKEQLSEQASMAAYAQQQQPQLQQQQLNHGNYPNAPPAANNYQGQYNQAHPNQTEWQAQLPNQAWQQSQLYEYQQQHLNVQQQQGQAQGQQPGQPPGQQYQYGQQQQQQQQYQLAPPSEPHRQSSFVSLPPIRRTSTLLSSIMKAGDDDTDANSVASSQQTGPAQSGGGNTQIMPQPQFANHNQMQMQGSPQQFQITGGYRPSHPGAVPPNQQAYMNNAGYQAIQQQGIQGSPQPQQHFQHGAPGQVGVRAFAGPAHPPGIAMANGHPQFGAQQQGQGQSPTPQFIPQVMRQTPALSPNAGGQIRLPPKGPWKLEESHLQQPLLSASRNRSPSNAADQERPFYGYDKETGLPAASPTPPPQQPQQSPAISQTGHSPQDNSQGQPIQGGQVLARTETADTADLPPPGPVPVADETHAKRNSGIFSSIRGRFSKDGPEDHHDSSGASLGGKFPTGAQHGHATSDAISESSVATEEVRERRKRHSLFGKGASSQLSQPSRQVVANAGPTNGPHENALVNENNVTAQQGLSTAFDHMQRMQQDAQLQQMPPPEKKRTFFGSVGMGKLASGAMQPQNPQLRPEMSRPSTSNTAQGEGLPPAGMNGGGPKKRFSALTSIFKGSGNHQEQGQKPPGSSHSARPSFSQGPPGGPQGFSMPGGPQPGQAFARPPGVPGPMFAQQVQQQPGAAGPSFAQGGPTPQMMQQRQQGPLQGQQPGQQQWPPQGQQSPLQQAQPFQPGQQSPQQQAQPFQQGQQAQPGQQRPVVQQSPSSESAQSPQSDGQTTPQGQQYPFSNQQGQQGQQLIQQAPGQQPPGQQQQGQFAQQRPLQQQAGQQSPNQTQQQFLQQRPVQQQPSQQSLGQQQQQPQFRQQPVQQQPGQQQPGMMGPPPPQGRGRSDSMGSRPFTAGEARPNPMMMPSSTSIPEERGRKPSSGGLLSSIFSTRSGSKPRDSKPGQRQAMMTPPHGQPQPAQQGYFGPVPGLQSTQYPPGQRMPSPLASQHGVRPMGSRDQLAQMQLGQQQPGQNQFMPQGAPGTQQFAQMQGQVPGQQRPMGPSQQGSQNTVMQVSPQAQQVQGQAGGARPMMHPQQQSQPSQASGPQSGTAQGQVAGLVNGQRTPSSSQLYPNQQSLAADAARRNAPSPLNQHPLQHGAPPQNSPHISQMVSQQDRMRQETVSPPIDDSSSKATGPSSSPQLQSPVSQVSQSVPFTPVERQPNDSPLSLRQHAPSQQQQQQQQTGQSEPPRQILQASTPATNQSSARKPVQTSPRPSEPSLAQSSQGASTDQSQGSPSISSAHTATASPVDESRRPSQQLASQRATSPLAQQPQLADQQQPSQRMPAAYPGANPQAGFPGAAPQPDQQPGQAQGGPPGQMLLNQQGGHPAGQQPGPAGAPMPAQPGQPYPGAQPPWMLARASTGASGLTPPSGQQLPGGPYFQTHPQNNAPAKEPHGTISKLLNKALQSSHSGPSQEKPGKEKGGKSRFGFLRSSKQPELAQRQQQPPPLQGGPRFQPGHPGRPMMQQDPSAERLKQLQAQIPGSDQQPRPSPTPSPGPHLQYQHQRQSPPNGVSQQMQPPGTPGQAASAGTQQPAPTTTGPTAGPGSGPTSGPPQQQQNAAATGVPPQNVPPPGQGRPAQGPPPGTQGRGQSAGSGQIPKPANQRQASAGQKPNEPQYGEVPIPTGYGKVHSEGRVEPAPVAYYMGPGGQFLPVLTGASAQQQQHQVWLQPGMAPRQPSYGPQGQQRVAQSPGQGGLSQQQSTQQLRDTPSVASPSAPTPTVQGAPVTAAGETPSSMQSRPEPERFDTALSQQSETASPPPQLQNAGSPHSYPLPDNAVLPPANDLSPLPNSDLVPPPLRPSPPPLKQSGNQLMMAVPQRQVSAVSQLSVAPGHSSPSQASSTSLAIVDSGTHLQPSSPSPEHPSLAPPPPAMNINVQQANSQSIENENIYDATPRTSSIPMQQPEPATSAPPSEQVEPKAAGPGSEMLDHRDQQQQSSPSSPPPAQNLIINAHTSPSPSPPPSTINPSSSEQPHQQPNGSSPPAQPNPADIFEEAKRKAQLRDMEEKIPVFPTEPDEMMTDARARAEAARKKAEDRPLMSATSYPGQEWNPYGDGYEEWE